MRIFVISLERSTDRRARVIEALGSKDIQFEFLNAVDASRPEYQYSERRCDALTRKRFGYTLTTGEIACFASHHLAWEKCLELNEPIMVLEDNCDFSERFFTLLSNLDTPLKSYSHIKLAATRSQPPIIKEQLSQDLAIVNYKRRTCGTMGYLITPDAAARFISGASLFIEPVDNYMEKPYKHGVKTFCFYPDLVYRAKIQSTIGSQRKNKSNLSIQSKAYIELFRLYEQFLNKRS